MNTPNETATSGNTLFPFFGGQLAANPFPMLATMRAQGPIIPLPVPYQPNQQIWLVTRLQEAVQVLKDKRFTVDYSNVDTTEVNELQKQRQEVRNTPGLFGQSMIAVDEPDHKRLRGLVSKAFTPKYIEGLRPAIQQIADDLLDKVQNQGKMDLVNDYGYPLPINVISDMLGVPQDQREKMKLWSESLAGGNGDHQLRMQSIRNFSTYISQLVADKRLHPQNDLISQLIQQEEAGDHLSEHELLSMVGLLIFAGHETTSNLIGIGTWMLLTHPDQFAKLKTDPGLVPSAVEELLRINGPVTFPTPRFATEDIEMHGQLIHKGDLILTALASANRDETQFSQPDELDIARELNKHIAFGQGIHICLGAPLARMEGDIAFTTLIKRMPNLKLAIPQEEVTWRGSFNLRGLTSLPVTF